MRIGQLAQLNVSTHSRAEAAAVLLVVRTLFVFMFQHTAAQRRLLPT